MKTLLKIIAVLALVFASTFLITNMAGLFSLEQVKYWLHQANELSPVYVGPIIVLLLFSDLFIAIPNLTVNILSGYFMGFPTGGLVAMIGMMGAGLCGYLLSWRYGDRLFKFLIKEEQQRDEAVSTFQKYGFVMILLSRAIPILPEVTACLAGLTKMKFSRFLLAWSLSSVPYSLIASYSGSVSSLDNPMPAIYTAISITTVLMLSWYIFRKYQAYR